MRITMLTLLLLTCGSSDLRAQSRWTLTLERGFTTYSEAAHDTSTPRVHVVPWHPTVHTLRLSRSGGRLGMGVGLSYARGELAGTVEEVVVLPGSRYSIIELAPEISSRVGVSASGAVLCAHAGPVAALWYPAGADFRSTVGAQAGATLSLPLAARWEVAVRADLAVTTSELTRSEASPGIIRPGTMRRGRLGLGITRRL